MAIVEIINVAMKLWCEMKLNYMRMFWGTSFWRIYCQTWAIYLGMFIDLFSCPHTIHKLMTHHRQRGDFWPFWPGSLAKASVEKLLKLMFKLLRWLKTNNDLKNLSKILRHRHENCFQTKTLPDNTIILKDLYTVSLRFIVSITHSTHITLLQNRNPRDWIWWWLFI
jgi:hypothetical protein